VAICDDILCGFSSGGMDDYIHTKSPCLPSNPSCPALFPFEPELLRPLDLVRLTLALTAARTSRPHPAGRRRATTSSSSFAGAQRQPATSRASRRQKVAIGDDGALPWPHSECGHGSVFVDGRYDYGDGNEHGEHGGQRGRALGALRVDEGGAGGVGGVSRRFAAPRGAPRASPRPGGFGRAGACWGA